MSNFDSKFIKSYLPPAGRKFQHPTMVRHKGVVIALAMDDQRRIFYAALDMNPAPQNGAATKSPFDVNNWPASPTELIFSNEIAEVGFGVADQTLLPTYQKGSRAPVDPGTRLDNRDKDFFLSTTARLTADAPFQALSDGRYVYIFRQAIAANHADIVFKRDKDGNLVKDKDGNPVPLADATLLVDRFVLVGTRLEPKLEVRFQRSRSKTRPQSRKDSLGAKDLDGNDFFEPTQELKFVGNLTGGRFTVLLLPTQVAEIQRWQIFTQNRHTGLIDAFNVERSAEGLFNTRGSQVYTCVDHPEVFAKQAGACVEPSLADPSQPCGKNLIPRFSKEGYAESALKFENASDHVALNPGVIIGEQFTQEAWIYPTRVQSTLPQAFIISEGADKNSGPAIWLEAQTRLRVGFGDGQNWNEFSSKSILTPNTWNHLAVTFDGAAYRFYVGGNLRDKIDLPSATKPMAQPIKFFGAAQNSFSGTIDEIRLWNRVRSSRELQADTHQRLTGLEPGLVGYWRFDEAEGDTVYDQTNNGANGTKHGGQWVTSDAPVGENPGVNRSSFQMASPQNDGQLESRSVESGMTAMLYYQQANVPSGYEGKEKPLKQNARVMLAVATKGVAVDDKNYIAALDFGVSNSGRIAQAPDRLGLNMINPDRAAQKPINDQLEGIRAAEAQVRVRSEAVVNAKRERDWRDNELKKLQNDLAQAQVIVYQGVSYDGAFLTYGRGDVPYAELFSKGFNDKIASIKIASPLQVTVYEHDLGAGRSAVFTGDTPDVGDTWRSIISSLRIAAKPEYDAKIQRAEERLRQARSEVTAQETLLNNAKKILDGLNSVLRSGAEATMPLVHIDSFGLSLSGGLLGFAWTNETPLLFDSATGTLALYFRGADDQFFAAYFNTFTERARYPLTDKSKQESVLCVARSTDLDMDKIVLEVSGDEESSTCTVTINGAGIEETWTKVPRASEKFARVLNGEAGHYENKRLVGYREHIGAGFIVAESQQLTLHVPDGMRRALEAGAALQVGETRVTALEAVSDGATNIPIASGAIIFTTEKLPIFFMEYDYAANAQTTKMPSDLFGGSLLIRAVPTAQSAVGNQRVTSGATVTSKWTAAAPGSTLTFDGESNYARLTDTAKLNQLDVVDDVTLEAWVRPNYMEGNARMIQHQSGQSNYTLGLHRPMSALAFDGSSYIDLGNGVSVGASFTQEAWIYPTSDNENFHGFLGNQPNGTNQRSPSLWVFQKNRIHAGFGDGETWNSFITGAVLTLDTWNHLAVTFDGTAYKVFVNGVLKYETTALAGKQPFNTPIKNIGRVDNYFNGRLDEVRIWKRARTTQEIQTDMNRRLSGNETDLVGYWHFEAGAKDYSRSRNDGTLHGELTPAPSALTVYAFFAGVNGKFVQSREIIPVGDWSHLAAVFAQDYGLKFDGVSGYLDGGKDDTLNINTDLTIEVFLQVDDLSQERGILTRGQIDDGTEQNVPYALALDRSGHLVFSFEDDDGNNHSFQSNASIQAGKPHRIAVTRKRQTLNYRDQGRNKNYTFAWDDIGLYLDQNSPEFFKYTYDDDVKEAIEEAQKTSPDNAKINRLVGSYPASRLKPADIGRSDQALVIGRTYSTGFFKGIISEVRIWNTSREAADIGKELTTKAEGLVSWWRFEEREGNKAADSAGQNHATINGNVKWAKDPDLARSRLILYCNDSDALLADSRNASDFRATSNQFSLGALSNSPAQEFFQGELEEVRIWKTVRTPEQIQDSLFRRLNGELDSLIAYYTFDAETQNQLKDQSLAGNHLTVEGTSFYILSTAPIGEDTPQVRSALAGVRTPFSGVIHSRPSVHEYGDLQYDNQGNLIGVFKRCYGFVKDGDWQLITGFKVGDLATEWIGQVQFAPQLIGYIEGTPPVPSENLTQPSVELIGDLDDYNGASVIELAEAQETTYTYSASKAGGFDLEVEAALKFGFKSKTDAGGGVGFISLTSIEESNILFGLRARFEASWSWFEEASTGVSRATGKTTSLELRGRYTTPEETTPEREPFGRRFMADNIGLALVQSETADVFALRLRHNNALIAFQIRPNPDIPKDWNIINFPINPRYVKQGTLDGKMGPLADVDYPNALTYSSDSSYFKPVEAYALKNRIKREETELQTYYDQFAAQDKGRPASFPSESAKELADFTGLAAKPHRNLINTYVWTTDGGLFAETQQTMDVQTETSGGSYEFKGMGGIDLAIGFAIAKVASVFELNAMFGGHQNLSVNKSKESKTAFQMNVNLDKVERDIYKRDPKDRSVVLIDNSDPKRPKPIKYPYKVDAYRFMTFYLEPNSDHFDLFFNRVVDPIWLEQSDDPAAVALREARQEGKKPGCWRIMHRVTYVSRVLPPLDDSAPPSLEKALQTLDIDSNYELIKQLEPYVSNKLTSFADFADAVRETIKQNLPELQPHTEKVIKYMSLYFGIADGQLLSTGDDKFGESSLFELAPNQPPIVNAGLDQTIGLDGPMTAADLDASVIDDRLQKAEAIFVTWERISGEGNVTFDDPHVMKTKATFTKRGRYVLRLTASDGLLTASDDLIVIVNERPIISAGPDQQVNSLQALLAGQIIDSGLGDPQTGTLTVTWSKQSRTGEANFDNKNALATLATFTTRGHYLLKLAVSNGTFDADDEVMIAVAARSTDRLQALYAFEENDGVIIHDVAGKGEPLDLGIDDPAAVQWVTGGLAVNAPALLATTGPATRLVEAVRSSNEITIEAWIKPASLNNNEGLARIATLASGAGTRNFLLGQRNGGFHAGLRTTTTNVNASNKVLAGGAANTNLLSHVVCTREASGLTRLYLNGNEVSRRMVDGNFASSWDAGFTLALGNEPGLFDGHANHAWHGTFHLVAIYSRALGPDEVKQNFDFGADANLPPIVSAGPDKIIDWEDIHLPKIATMLEGRITHDRPTPTTIINWTQVGGPGSPNGVTFENENSSSTKVEFNQKGRYVFRLTADDGELLMSDEVVIVVNRPPQVRINNGTTPKLALTEQTAVLELAGELLDSGLGDDNAANSMSYKWSRISGPTTIQIENPQQLQTKVRFTQRGVYALKLEAGNGRLSTIVSVTITVNQKPVVNAGSTQIVTLPAEGTPPEVQATLTGAVTDTGLGNPQESLLIKWEKISGPDGATVDFVEATQLQTTATFNIRGIYVLGLTTTNRDNPELTANAEVTITVNELPIVDAGPDLEIVLPAFAALDGIVSDDGLPVPPGIVTTKWTKVNGAGQIILADDNAAFTTARFVKSGDYVFRLTAKDYAGGTPVSDEVKIKVLPSARVTQNLQALYVFQERGGEVVHDVSGVDVPLDLKLQNLETATALRWLGKGLRIIAPTILKPISPANRLVDAMKATNEITIEAWIKRAPQIANDQSPGRIVTFSAGFGSRNFMLAQDKTDIYEARLRTTITDDDGVNRRDNNQRVAQEIGVVADLCHIVYTRDASGKVRFYLNGADPVGGSRPKIEGTLDNWSTAFEFALANETTGNRPWLGDYYLIAIYNHALTEAEVRKNLAARF
ncbi:MAG: LamG-like jellyroll fold domain-containing protein [bacterium]